MVVDPDTLCYDYTCQFVTFLSFVVSYIFPICTSEAYAIVYETDVKSLDAMLT